MAGTTWQPFNEKNPWGKEAVAISEDNITASTARHEAIKAMKERRATPEQRALVLEADAAIQDVLSKR